MSNIPNIPLRTIRQAALEAGVCEKTALRATLGLPVRPAGRERLLEALARHGVDVSKISTGVVQAASSAITTTTSKGS
jgi:hypothetical protein